MTPHDVTICIPTIPGRENYRDRAVASAKAQCYPSRILIERDPERTGAAATRNRLLARVETPYIAWLDDDDELLPHHVGALRFCLEDFDLIYPTPRIVSGQDNTAVTQGGIWRKPWGVPFGPEQESHLRHRGSFIPMTHLVRTDLARQAGGFPEGRTMPDGRYSGEDERYLIGLLNAGARFRHIDITTWVWHMHAAHTAGKPTQGNPAECLTPAA